MNYRLPEEKRIRDEIAEVKEVVIEIRRDLKHYSNTLEDHNVTLYGNGKPGLKSTVERHSVIINILIGVGSLIGTSLIAAICAAFYKLINLA